MAKRNGPAKIKKYSLELKLKAVQLSDQPGVLIKDAAQSLCIRSGGCIRHCNTCRQLLTSVVARRRCRRYTPQCGVRGICMEARERRT
jgi:hypothetical protein